MVALALTPSARLPLRQAAGSSKAAGQAALAPAAASATGRWQQRGARRLAAAAAVAQAAYPDFMPPEAAEIEEAAAQAMMRTMRRVALDVEGLGAAETAYVGPASPAPGRPAFVLLHGFDSSCLEFRRLHPLLSQLGDVYAVDLAGWGEPCGGARGGRERQGGSCAACLAAQCAACLAAHERGLSPRRPCPAPQASPTAALATGARGRRWGRPRSARTCAPSCARSWAAPRGGRCTWSAPAWAAPWRLTMPPTIPRTWSASC